MRQLLQTVNQQQNRSDLRALVEAIDSVKQKISLLEASDQRLGVWQSTSLMTSLHDVRAANTSNMSQPSSQG